MTFARREIAVKHTKFSYTPAFILAKAVIEVYYNEESVYGFSFDEFWSDCRDEIIPKLLKPHKETVLHIYIKYTNDFIDDDPYDLLKNIDFKDYEQHLYFLESMIRSGGISLKHKMPDFDEIEQCMQCGVCKSCVQFSNFLEEMGDELMNIEPTIINTTFHLLMLNKSFLKDFHENIALFLEDDIDYIKENYSSNIRTNNKLKRVSWPAWLKRGIFYRDNGVCVVCRSDLTGVVNIGGSFELDHIVPLSKFGNNDSSNLQVLCKGCNINKSDKDNQTSVIEVPLWDYQ